METIAIIPARSGSRGIPSKNIQPLGEIPLMAHSIRTALAVPRISRVIVSTDSPVIAEIARSHGAEVPFLRPEHLSGDRAIIGEASNHLLTTLQEKENYSPEAVAHLYPTHPFRSPELLDFLLGKIEMGYKAVFAVRLVNPATRNWVRIDAEGKIKRLSGGNLPHGHDVFRSYGYLIAIARKPSPFGDYLHPLSDPEEFIDIDEPEDMVLARAVVSRDKPLRQVA